MVTGECLYAGELENSVDQVTHFYTFCFTFFYSFVFCVERRGVGVVLIKLL